MDTKTKSRVRLKALSPKERAQVERFWNEKLLKDNLLFVPTAERAKILDPTEARKKNELFGEFAANYLKDVLRRITRNSDVIRRQKDGKRIVAVGYGYGYDSKWLDEASKAGLQTWWVDVSMVASLWASVDLRNQFDALSSQPNRALYKEPMAITFEIQSLLAEPDTVELDLASVEIWYLSRLLNCLPTKSAKVVLQEIGRTALGSDLGSSRRNAVVIINALSNQNPGCCTPGGVSIVRSKEMILANLSYGARRRVEPCFVQYYQYFGKLVTAMTVMVKQ